MEYGKRVIALGFFDGVHIGHGALLRKTIQIARGLKVEPAVLSFDSPPGKPVELINSSLDRADIMTRLYGITDLIFLHFDDKLRTMEWQDFVEWLKNDFGAVHLVAGYDFTFGYRGEGNAEKLVKKCAELKIGCDIIGRITLEGETVSSTAIRDMLLRGEMERANRFLGHKHILNDTVRYGFRAGRRLGTPTINMRFERGVVVPRYGVYAAEAYILDDGQCYAAVTDITLSRSGEREALVESHLLGYKGNLYGKRIRIEFYKFLRPQVPSISVEELRGQIRSDAVATLAYLGKNPEAGFADPFYFPEE